MTKNKLLQAVKGLTLAAGMAVGIFALGQTDVLADTLTLTVEKNTIGQGMILEPTQVEFSKGETCADVPLKPEITIDDFAKLDLRVGEIISAEKAENSRKLLIFKVKCGSSVRQIVSGIAKYYKPEDLVGKKVIFVANLKTAVLGGHESQGMILAAEDDQGTLSMLTTDKPLKSGSPVS